MQNRKLGSQRPVTFHFKLVVALVWSLTQISTDIYLPSMPAMATYFNTSLPMIQYTIFFYTVGFSLGALFFGPLSDRIGRRPIILISLTLAAFGSLLATCATNLHILFLARFIQGVALVGVGSTMRAIVKDVCSSREEMSRLGAILGIILPVSWAIAPVIGGYIQQYTGNWRISFAFLLVYIISFLVYLFNHLAETNHNLLTRPLKFLATDYKEVLSNINFLYYNTITAFAMCTMTAYFTASSFLLQIKVGLTPEEFGFTNLTISITSIIASYINTKMVTAHGIDKMLSFGMLLLCIAGALFLINGIFMTINIYSIMIPLTILSFSSGIVYPNASAGALSLFSTNAGTAGAVYACGQMLGGVLGSGFITLAMRYGNTQQYLGAFICIQGIIGLILYYSLIKTSKYSTLKL